MNILLINHYAGSMNSGMEYRPYYMAKEWVKRGHNVTIIASSYSHLRSQNIDMKTQYSTDNIDGINYLWIKTPHYEKNGVKRIVNMFSFAFKLFGTKRKYFNFTKPDLVIASSPHPFIIYGAKYIAKKYTAKLVFEVRDLWPITLTELGLISKKHPFSRMMQFTENFAYKHADKVISLLPKAEEYMREHGLEDGKFMYVPNGINLEEWYENKDYEVPITHQEVIQRIRKKGHFIVGYTGRIGIANALEYFVDSAKYLENEQITYVIIGTGPELEGLKRKTEKLDIKNIVFLEPISKKSIPQMLKSMDALYIGWRREKIYRFGISPNKLMDYMLASKPIIHSVEAGNDIVEESGCGISIEPESPKKIAEAVIRLAKSPKEQLEEIGKKGREYVIANNSYGALSEKVVEDIEKR